MPALSRRRFLAAGAGLSLLAPLRPGFAAEPAPRRLTLRAGAQQLRTDGPATPVWGYEGAVPGPILTALQGSLLDVEVLNALPEPTTTHWHGLRLPNAMDGVAGLTQPAIEPGGSFRYSFPLPDAGTFWYHPHFRTSGQLGRGLYGALVVQEPEPPEADRDLLWVLGDWRLDAEGRVIEDFADPFAQAHDGRIGELVTLNERAAGEVPVRAGERLRLRLVNACQARVFGLAFEGEDPLVVARDGQPCRPHGLGSDRLWLGPGMRTDLMIDCAGLPGARHAVMDHRNPGHPAVLATLAYAETRPLRDSPLDAPAALPPNPLAPPDLGAAPTLEVVLAGGMGHGGGQGMGGQGMGGEGMGDQPAHGMAGGAAFWTINGQAMPQGEAGHPAGQAPLFALQRGRTYRLAVRNESDRWHPLHLHGMHMKLLAENGRAESREIWLDTLLLPPDGTAEAALVADNPGDWMFHCHVLQHQESGMSAVLRVA